MALLRQASDDTEAPTLTAFYQGCILMASDSASL